MIRALDATLRITGPRGTRDVPAEAFFHTHFTTAVEADELLVEIGIPRARPGTGAAFTEVSRRHGDFALVGVAAQVTLERGVVADARICLSGVADQPLRCSSAEAALLGGPVDARTARAAADAAREGLEPTGDLHATVAYRRDVAGTLVERALMTAAARAQGGDTA